MKLSFLFTVLISWSYWACVDAVAPVGSISMKVISLLNFYSDQ
jgi:hypothetical protein